jgi:hypothetical protein
MVSPILHSIFHTVPVMWAWISAMRGNIGGSPDVAGPFDRRAELAGRSSDRLAIEGRPGVPHHGGK